MKPLSYLFSRSLCLFFSLVFSLSLFAQPGNDNCASATNLTPTTSCGATAGQTLALATSTGSPSSMYGTTYDVWYRFTVPAGVSTLNIALSGLTNPTFINANNSYIEVFNATSCAGVTAANSLGTANAITGITLFNAVAGNQYYFRVFTRTNPTTTPATRWGFSICVSYPLAPANDNCGTAVVLTAGVTNTAGRVSNATASASVPLGCATGNPDDDVWYRFTATNTWANVTVSNNSVLATSGAMIQVFSGSCALLNPLACGRESVALTGLNPGDPYFIRVYSFGTKGTPIAGFSGNNGAGANFNISVTPGPETNVVAGRMNELYRQTVLSNENLLADPWEITYAPDGQLWITESKGYRVFKMDPNTGARTTVLDISPNSTFLPAGDRSFNAGTDINVAGAQGGLAGMAFHPQFMNGTGTSDFVYISYIDTFLGGAAPTGLFFTNRLVRFTYNPLSNKLESPVSLCDTLPGGNDHNSQRMIVAPVSGTSYLFYASGDLGAGQFDNQNRTMKAQDSLSYEGKILRFNLVPDGDAGLSDRWIPNTNPYNKPVQQSAVWCIGIRNNQGFAYDPETDLLYGSSHGPYSDDEINIIQRYRNYGHPLVIGFAADENYANCSAGTTNAVSSCPVITSEVTNRNTINSSGYASYQDPIFSAYTSSPAVTSIFTNIWSLTSPPNNGTWPSEGWSGLDIYKHTLIPGWKNSLVAASLKWGRVLRIKLAAGGTSTMPVSDTVSYFGGQNRFRDIAFNPNGKDIYVVMDRSTTTSGPSSAFPVVPSCQGCLQKYSFLGYADAAGKSSIPTSIPVTNGVDNICNTGTTITIDNSNNNIWVPITGPDGNIMAEINANGNNLGTVTSSFYENSGPIRISSSVRYLNRNITITPQNQPTLPAGAPLVKVRFYMSAAEFNALDADGLSGVNAIGDLRVLKNNDACGSQILTSTSIITPQFAEPHGAGGYMLQANIDGFSSFYFASTNVVLPVEFLTFEGRLLNNGSVELTWDANIDAQHDYFEVERSFDQNNFVALGRVVTAPPSVFIDPTAKPGNNYYRIKQVDKDGSVSYSRVINIIYNRGRVNYLLYPNPVTDVMKIRFENDTPETYTITVTDLAGRPVVTKTVAINSLNSEVNIDLKDKAAQVYLMTIRNSRNELVASEKIIKQ